MTTKKLTKKDFFNALKNEIAGLTYVSGLPRVEVENFINHELELLAKKNSSNGTKKKTPTQIENEKLMQRICEVLSQSDKPMTISEIQKEDDILGDFTVNKVSALMTLLKNSGQVVRTEEKRKAYFSLAVGD